MKKEEEFPWFAPRLPFSLVVPDRWACCAVLSLFSLSLRSINKRRKKKERQKRKKKKEKRDQQSQHTETIQLNRKVEKNAIKKEGNQRHTGETKRENRSPIKTPRHT